MPMTSRRRLIACLTVALLAPGATAARAGEAPDYPSRQVTLIVSFPPGGSSDFFTRLLGSELSRAWNRPVLVENRPGAGGNIGAQAAARAQPDGYTLFMSSINTHAINASLYKSLGYDPVKDFAPISRVATVPNVLVVNPTVPARTVAELVAWLKANPKRALYASPGIGTGPHLSSELFRALTGAPLAHVAYKGSAPALTDVVGGQIPMAIDNLPAALGLIRGGKLRALGVTSAGRSDDLPEVPTMIEAGVPGFVVVSWWGLFAPAGVPEPILRRVHADVVRALNSPAVKASIENQGGTAAPSSPAELAGLVRSETARWGQLIREMGIRAD
jgi:tripartite-type tricarboxylate transporter receptor subunit TctC